MKKKMLLSLVTMLATSATFANDCPDFAAHIRDAYDGKALILSSCGIGDNDIDGVVKFVNSHPEITVLALDQNYLHAKSGYKLINLPNIESLSLARNHLGDEGAKVLATPTKINQLDLWDNQISDEGAQALANNKNLIVLTLDDNRITDKGISALAQSNIQFLDVDDNMIGDEGATALASDQNLKQLRVGGNRIGDIGAYAFAQATTLPWLDISYNNISVNGIKALRANSHIEELIDEGNPGSTQ